MVCSDYLVPTDLGPTGEGYGLFGLSGLICRSEICSDYLVPFVGPKSVRTIWSQRIWDLLEKVLVLKALKKP